jgi:uncharacterized tellurite resistance protein B-like protein
MLWRVACAYGVLDPHEHQLIRRSPALFTFLTVIACSP